jgi:hypothetical protein
MYLIICLIIIFLILYFWFDFCKCKKDEHLTNREIIRLLDEPNPFKESETDDDRWIKSLPKNSNCADLYDNCAKWAANDECQINPEFMLYNCPSSCQACSLTLDQKNRLDQIYNSRPPLHCVVHEPYPGEFSYLDLLYEYNIGTKL